MGGERHLHEDPVDPFVAVGFLHLGPRNLLHV